MEFEAFLQYLIRFRNAFAAYKKLGQNKQTGKNDFVFYNLYSKKLFETLLETSFEHVKLYNAHLCK